MSDTINFKQAKMNKGINRVAETFRNLENMNPITMAEDVYMEKLYYYSCGQSGKPDGKTYGWLQGVEYMMGHTGIDFQELRQEVKTRIENEGREIVYNDFLE